MPRLRRQPPPPSDDLDDDDECFREKPIQRNAANARERARMRILSKAFSRLKTTLPWVPADTKLSKLDTLRLATSYIAHLRTILTHEGETLPVVHPLNLTWPFTIQNQAMADAAKSPAWSSEDNSPPMRCQGNLLSCMGDSSSCAEGDGDEEPKCYDHEKQFVQEQRCYQDVEQKNFGYLDHRHYSDSLMNIG